MSRLERGRGRMNIQKGRYPQSYDEFSLHILLSNIQPHFITTWLEAIQKSVKELRERGIQAFRRKAWKQAKKETNTVLCMQIILNCQELRILMRTKYKREVRIQKTGKKK